ncbi:lysine N-acyltransferase mbtK [Streptomyces viridochromogenes DSM 40736]|uniref:Lysine N-acyltransferase MbtK n=1 Tax=Streptomyces viridochromogenes (strain DSM 40736 / JCM 4977 / BCRC 1201 / Tue 494) TaxID=591159 RepID=D9WZ13_STRVT|nr:lysine N-acyltransferase mbtK [Streptomyces viridochromogenes DSM 40736]
MPPADPTTGTDSAAPVPDDVSSDAASGSDAESGPLADSGADGQGEDTMDLHLPDEFLALIAKEEADSYGARWPAHDTAEPSLSHTMTGDTFAPSALPFLPTEDDLLDRVAGWGPVDTSAGIFHLVPVRIERDLPLVSRWMNDPAAAAFWELSGPPSVTEDHLRAQLGGDGRSIPCIGALDGTPMSYWEIYRADLDPLARHYPAKPHDTGLHLLVGAVADRGRGLGGLLLRAVADLVLARRPSCARVIAEPDIRNTPSIAAFLTAGFRFSSEVDLPAKRAALMVRDRSLRNVM